MTKAKTLLATLAFGLLATTTALAGEVRIMWYSDGVEGEVLQDLMDRFMVDNPDIDVIIDNVSYSTVREQLPVQLEAGSGPDIARVTDLKAQSEHWLDLTPYVEDADYWRDNFGDQADWMRPDGSDAITGFMTQITLTGGYANKTLFDQAGIEIPGPEATWDEWMEIVQQVATSQQVPFPAAMDRSGHRISGPNISFGANYVGADGLPAPIDDGVKAMVSRFVEWNAQGIMNPEVWVSASGTTYRAAADDFINGQLVYYYSGNWQISNLSTKIGDTFDWVATGSPCGTAACSGMPGGAGLVAVKYTKNPEDVGKVMDYLASAEVVKEFSERTLFIPAHRGVIAQGLQFQSDDPQVNAALSGFVAASASTDPNALFLPGWKWAGTYYGALVSRTSQVIAGELTLEEAYERMDADIAAKVAEISR
ncbi:MAG: carbohydrate ABC transporter substrate-binding protein [Alphaproteobacteria bacterium]|nr:carbohydrate ABC transporter substrate-binding protein [Alphaproteobacteria bacterium]